MTKTLLSVLVCLLFPCAQVVAQAGAEVVIPGFDDKYTGFVKQQESGHTAIDYRAFRESFIESKQFNIAAKKSSQLDSLEKEMYSLMSRKKYPEIIAVTKQMLSIDYTSLTAHKILRQTYKIVGDTAKAARYKTIQFGLLNSIVRNGDGKSCATAWPVIQLSEEYFILGVLGAQLLKQSTDRTGGLCDKMDVKTEEGDKRTYYFETSKVFAGYRQLGLK